MAPIHLNYHHLQYFWAVAKEGNLTRAARRLRVSQSALSTQIRQLEEQLGQPLFEREGRTLRLNEAGRIALGYAEEIFSTGGELLSTLQEGRRRTHALRVGAVATLSRNFQDSFIAPILGLADLRLSLVSGRLDELLGQLAAHSLDLVLANRPISPDHQHPWRCRHLAHQEVSLVSHTRRRTFRFPRDLGDTPLLLPGPESPLRSAFDALCEKANLSVRVVAEIDDMAMMRLLARDMQAMALLPSVVVRDELQAGVLHECCVVPNLFEDFYAITISRRYQHPLLGPLLSRSGEEILGMG
jgi:LysR family transcriptional activator of nhaA